MTDAELAASFIGALAALGATIAGAIRWSGRRKAKSQDQSTQALIKSAQSSTLLAARVDALNRRDADRKEFESAVTRIKTVADRLGQNDLPARVERLVKILEGPGLNEAQLAKLARVRGKIVQRRGLLPGTAKPTAARPPNPRDPSENSDEDP